MAMTERDLRVAIAHIFKNAGKASIPESEMALNLSHGQPQCRQEDLL